MHNLPLIPTVAAAFTAAWLLGLLTQWLRLSPIVGYLLAGVLIGPYTPGFVGDVEIAQQLAEVGVILLMFGVGMHFHVKDLLAVRNVAVPGAVVQSLTATVVAMGLFSLFGMPLTTGAVLGMAMAVASTVVLMRVLMDANMMHTRQGHVAVGWLIVEDIFTVVLLVVIPVLGKDTGGGGGASIGWTLGLALVKLAILTALVLWGGSRVVPWVLVRVARLRSRELFTLTVLVFSIAVAAASYFFFDASMALGAFLAGMVVAQSPVSSQAAADAMPMRDAFAVLFFVSVGMLFEPVFLLREPLMVAAGLAVILIAKPLAALVIVAVLGHSVRTALTVAIGLAQIGEFSFILSELARQFDLMPDAGHNVLVASAIISITLNPMLFRSLPRVEAWLRGHPRLWRWLNGRAERRVAAAGKGDTSVEEGSAVGSGASLAIVIGYGPVGRSVHQVLKDAGMATMVVDFNVDTVATLKREGQRAIFGDATNEGLLTEAGVTKASHLVITLPDAAHRAAVLAAGRNLNPNIRIFVRARYLRERDELERLGATSAVFEETEAAVALARLVLSDTGLHGDATDRKLKEIRLRLIMDSLSNLGTQRISSVMVPWSRVHALSAAADLPSVLARIAQERIGRWPVVDPTSGEPVGYLETGDLAAGTGRDTGDWTRLIRPLESAHLDDSIEVTINRMRDGGDSCRAVRDAVSTVGFVTLGHILNQVAGRLADGHPHEAPVTLLDAVSRGAIVSPLVATSRDQAIRELVAAVPANRLPAGLDHGRITKLALEREAQLSTDLGNGVAIPHARCPGLMSPLMVVGKAPDGVVFSVADRTPVRLIFLLLTPEGRPETQLALLSQLARVAGKESSRAALMNASSPVAFLEVLESHTRSLPAGK